MCPQFREQNIGFHLPDVKQNLIKQFYVFIKKDTMRKTQFILTTMVAIIYLTSCTKTESDFTTPTVETISIVANQTTIEAGTTVRFSVLSSINNTNVTTESKFFINGAAIASDTFNFTTIGTFAVYATKGTLTTNVLSIQVNAVPVVYTGFVNNILVEEYSGTWCGNCPRLLYGVELLHQQTNKAIVVGIHLFNGDPFITTQGNDLAANLGVSGVPTGNINRTTSWTGPQYQNVPQVLNEIQTKVATGIAINSTNTSGTISANIKLSYKQAITTNTKLTVYLVEDSLYYTQRNYSSNIYGGLSSIPNFKYDGVLRSVVTDIGGDAVANSGTLVTKSYNFTLPGNITNTNHIRLVALVTDGSGKVLNAQTAKVGDTKDFENL